LECGGLPPLSSKRKVSQRNAPGEVCLARHDCRYPVGALLVNRAAVGFILRSRGAGSKGCAPARQVVRPTARRTLLCSRVIWECGGLAPLCGSKRSSQTVAGEASLAWRDCCQNIEPRRKRRQAAALQKHSISRPAQPSARNNQSAFGPPISRAPSADSSPP